MAAGALVTKDIPAGKLVAGLSISAPSDRLEESWMDRVKATAAQISAALEVLTREKLVVRNCDSVVPLVACNMVTKLPSSMP